MTRIRVPQPPLTSPVQPPQAPQGLFPHVTTLQKAGHPTRQTAALQGPPLTEPGVGTQPGRDQKAGRHLQRLCIGILLGSVLTAMATGCAPKVVRSAPPLAPTSAIEMAGDTDRLEQVMAAGQLKKDELRRTREVYLRSLEELKERQSRDEGLQQLSIKRIELTIQLYDNLLALTEQPVSSRADKADLSIKAYGFERDYLRKLMEFEQGIELLPQTLSMAAPVESAGVMKVESLPPPPTSRLMAAYRAGRFEQVTREVEGSGADALTRMPPASIAVYALALGAVHRYDDAETTARLVDREALLPEEQLELRYRQGLWLLKLGKRDEAIAVLKNLSQDAVLASKRLDEMRPRLSATFEDTGRGSPRFQEQIIEGRLALEEDRWEDARVICRGLLEKETTVETVNRVEALLRQIDADEERAFRAEYDELVTVIDVDRGPAAEEAINKLSQRFPTPRHQSRIQLLRNQLAERTKARDAADATPDRAVSPPGTAAPAPTLKPEPTRTEAPKVEPARPEPTKAEPAKTEPPKVEPAKAEPTKTEPAKVEPAKVEPAKTEPAKVEPAKTEPLKAEPAKVEPAKTEPAKTAPAAATDPSTTVKAAEPAPRPHAPLTPDAQQKVLADARAQVKAGNYEQAIELFGQLEGTALSVAASDEQQKAIDLHIQKVRERVARDFVQASSLGKDEKARRLQSLHDVLRESLERYPTTTLKAKVEQNMRVLEQELKKLSQG